MSAAPLAHTTEGPEDAPAVVLLHAIATHGALWQAQAPVWACSFRVVRIDLPGHGRSAPAGDWSLRDAADRVRATLDQLGIARAALVGVSLGGMVAQAFALAFPDRVSALVLAHTGARTDPAVRELWSRRLAQCEATGLAGQLEPTLERWFTRDFAARSPHTLQWVAAQILATPPEGFAAAVRAIQDLDHLDRLPAVRTPTLVIAGDSDTAVPPAAAARLAEAIPGAQLVVLQDAAHLGNVQQPVAFTEAVGAFLQRVLRPAGSAVAAA